MFCRCCGHFAAKGIDFANDMAFGRSPIDGLHGMNATMSRLIVIISVLQPIRRGESRFAAGMAGADDNDIKAATIKTHMKNLL